MDQKSTETLELPRILERLSGFAAFSASKELGSNLRPSAEYERVLRTQKETSEARVLLSVNSALTVGGAHDVRAQADAAQRGAVLVTVERCKTAPRQSSPQFAAICALLKTGYRPNFRP